MKTITEKVWDIPVYVMAGEQHGANRIKEEVLKILRELHGEPFDLENPLPYEELRDFYILHNGCKS